MKRGLEKISPVVRSCCELLGVNPGANDTELKRAYHRLAFIYHPDRNAHEGAEKEFRKITAAYETLVDPLRVAELNRKYLTERLHKQVIEGLNITFGTFFGYRLFRPGDEANPSQTLRLGSRASPKKESASDDDFWKREPIEENNSILDHAAFDALEVVYAGRLSTEDEEAVKGEVDGRKLLHLPWVVLNNQGLLRFLDGDIRRSGECYRKLCERVPNNIIFTYRYGLCLILDAFQNPRRTLLGTRKPDAIKIAKGLELLEHCVKLGQTRSVGRQKCLVIRKTIADVREKMGQTRRAQALWTTILKDSPSSVEAIARIKGSAAAEKRLKDRHERESLANRELGSSRPRLGCRT